MKARHCLVGLGVVNLVLLIFLLLSRTEPALATTGVSVLRGTALEIVDRQGRVRASIKVQPAETFKPTVKIGASVAGGGLSLVGKSDGTRVLLQAEGNGSSLRLTNQAGRERVVEP